MFKKGIIQYTLRLFKTDECRLFLRRIDSNFPLERKSSIWRNKEYRLFEEIDKKPTCRYCFNQCVSKNGKNQYGKQKYYCNICKRNFVVGKWSKKNEK